MFSMLDLLDTCDADCHLVRYCTAEYTVAFSHEHYNNLSQKRVLTTLLL
jgi:hypothetical protein